mgnify:CR=1 FL=1
MPSPWWRGIVGVSGEFPGICIAGILILLYSDKKRGREG